MIHFSRSILVVALLATGCSSSLLSSGGSDPQELAEIKSRVLELQRAAAITQVEVDRLRQQLAALESRLLGSGDSPPAAARVPPAPEPVVDTPRPIEVAELEPLPATSPPRAPSPPPTNRPAAPSPRPASPPPAVTPVPTESDGADPALGEGAQALYDRGYTLYHQGRYVDAEAAFRRFLQADRGGSLADNAQYWIGESRFARGEYEAALAAFEEGVARYPAGNKVADSLLKAADCRVRLGDQESARALYDEVVRRFPGSAAAAMAEERRARLRG